MGRVRSGTNGRIGRWARAGGLGTAGAVLLVAAVMALAPAATASAAAAFKGSIGSPSYGWSESGCGKIKSSPPRWSAATGVATWYANGTATSCKGGVSGYGSSSDVSANGQETVYAPVKVPTGYGGVNVTWSLSGYWDVKVVKGTTSHCPGYAYNYSYYYYYYSSWVNTSYNSTDCSADASIDIGGYAELIDTSTNSYYYSNNYWYGISHDYDWYTDYYQYQTNWSNPLYYSNNYTSWSSYGYQSGSNGGGTFSIAPTWFINGTFVKTDHYIVETYIYVNVYADLAGQKGGKATAVFDGKTAGRGEALGIAVW